jgi:hypothetical protein
LKGDRLVGAAKPASTCPYRIWNMFFLILWKVNSVFFCSGVLWIESWSWTCLCC